MVHSVSYMLHIFVDSLLLQRTLLYTWITFYITFFVCVHVRNKSFMYRDINHVAFEAFKIYRAYQTENRPLFAYNIFLLLYAFFTSNIFIDSTLGLSVTIYHFDING